METIYITAKRQVATSDAAPQPGPELPRVFERVDPSDGVDIVNEDGIPAFIPGLSYNRGVSTMPLTPDSQ